MSVFIIILAICWFGSFVALFFGYKPSTFTIGCAFLISAFAMLSFS